MVKGKAEINNGIQFDFKWLCIPCLLRALNLIETGKHKGGEYNYDEAMKDLGRNDRILDHIAKAHSRRK